MSLYPRPTTLAEAQCFVGIFHRHHKAPVSHRFSLGVATKEGVLLGVAVVGRPVARGVPQYTVAEVVRLCTDGTKNACSFLYSRAARVCREMGYSYIQTYILEGESGVSLLAAGWVFDGWTAGGDWNTPARGGRSTDQPQVRKQRWKKVLNP